jgi:hypothetical protein
VIQSTVGVAAVAGSVASLLAGPIRVPPQKCPAGSNAVPHRQALVLYDDRGAYAAYAVQTADLDRSFAVADVAGAVASEIDQLLTSPRAYLAMANAVNPYGDGRAAQRTAEAIEHMFGFRGRPEPIGGGTAGESSAITRAATGS